MIHLALALMLLQQPAAQDGPNSPAMRERNAQRHHDAVDKIHLQRLAQEHFNAQPKPRRCFKTLWLRPCPAKVR